MGRGLTQHQLRSHMTGRRKREAAQQRREQRLRQAPAGGPAAARQNRPRADGCGPGGGRHRLRPHEVEWRDEGEEGWEP